MRTIILIGAFFFICSCKQKTFEKQDEEFKVIYIRKIDTDKVPEQIASFEYKTDTVKYKISKPLGEYQYAYRKVFTDSILHLWNRVSMENIIKTDPKLLNNDNYNKYQILKIGDNNRTEFWRMVNRFYFSLYDFDKGFYVVETFSFTTDPYYRALYLIVSQYNNKYVSYQFRLGIWDNSELIAYLKNIKEIDYDTFYACFTELKKQNKHDEFIWGLSELTVSYFHNDTIESYVNIEYGNFEIVSKIEKLLNGIK